MNNHDLVHVTTVEGINKLIDRVDEIVKSRQKDIEHLEVRMKDAKVALVKWNNYLNSLINTLHYMKEIMDK